MIASRPFTTVVVVDWSASSRPKLGADSIWIGIGEVSTLSLTSENVPTRAVALEGLTQICLEHFERGQRVLLGVDFSLGYPAGTAAAIGLEPRSWRGMWRYLADRVVDGPDNANNRFEVAAEMNRCISGDPGPFWGCPPGRRSATLDSTKPQAFALDEWRLVEAVLRARGHRPFSSWQLLGVGSVGSQSLVGIATLARLVDRLADQGCAVDVWPFSGRSPGGDVVIAEVWPSLFGDDATECAPSSRLEMVRDERQVRATAAQIARRLGFDPSGDGLFELDLSESDLDQVVIEEGWILGA